MCSADETALILNFKNKTMIKIEAKIIADSINPQGDRLTSILVTFPRIILAEVNTHRMLSKNTSSSRAIPFEKMVESIQNDPFIPIAFQKHHSGMQGTEYITDEKIIDFKKGVWLNSRNKAIQSAEELYYNVSKATSINDIIELENTGVTKQLCNRLLEPFMWHTTLVTATEFSGFFELRCPKYIFGKATNKPRIWKSKKDAIKDFPNWETHNDLFWRTMNESQAEIHIQALAEAMWDARNESTPKQLQEGEWHIPMIEIIED